MKLKKRGLYPTRLSYLTRVYREIHNMAMAMSKGSDLTGHRLEKGLSNEEIIRSLLEKILPKTYGVAKGKVVNSLGNSSRQVDIIVYDALRCPNLFIDQNKNQILPIEGVFAVIEVKTELDHSKLIGSFENIKTVKELLEEPVNVSTNDHVKIIPPLGIVIAYSDERSLEAIYDQYVELNRKYQWKYRSLSYDRKSPAYAEQKRHGFVVDEVTILNKGIVHYMYTGTPVIFPAGVDSLGCLIVNLFGHLREMELRFPSLYTYYAHTTLFYDQKTKTQQGWVMVKPAVFKSNNR
jgi:hypothetical protein